MTLQKKIDALPPWADEISLGGLEEDRNTIDLWAALARLMLTRDVLTQLEPYIDSIICYASTCTEWPPNDIAAHYGALLKALEVRP